MPAKPRRRRYRDANLNVLTINVHVGLVAYVGGVRWLLARHPRTALVLVQEAERKRARAAVRASLPWPVWAKIGPTGDQRGGTYVYARRTRFKVLGRTNRLVSRGRTGMHPTRRLVAAELLDKVTGRVVDASSVHTWHIVGRSLERPDNPIVKGHVAQVRAHAEHHAAQHRRDPDSVQLAGGDYNEQLAGPAQRDQPNSASRIMRDTARMAPAHLLTKAGDRNVRLDDVYLRRRPFLEVLARKVIRLPFKVADHPAVWVRLRIKALESR